MIFVGMDVASVNSAVVTSSGDGLKVQPPKAKKDAGTRWERTLSMADALVTSQDLLTESSPFVLGMEDVRFGGGGRFDDTGELRGILKYHYSLSTTHCRSLVALQPQQWRAIMSIASGLPVPVRYAVYRERAEALGFVAEAPEFSNAKAREDATTAFLIAKAAEWLWTERFGDGLPVGFDPGFPLGMTTLVQISARGKEEWLR